MRLNRGLLAAMLLIAVAPGCSQLTRIEDKVDAISAESHTFQKQQKKNAQDLAEVRKALDAEGITSDEKRAEMLSRFKNMERSLQQIEARMEEQDDLLLRIQANLDLLGRAPAAASAGGVGTTGADSTGALDGNAASNAAATEGEPAHGVGAGGANAAATEGEPAHGVGAGGASAAATEGEPAHGVGAGGVVAGGASAAAGAPAAGAADSVEVEQDSLGASGSPGAEVYDAAFRDFTRGSYTLARVGFEEFLSHYPGSDLADNARYWMGESWYAQGNYREAADEFEGVLHSYPDSDMLPAALLKASNCYLELDEKDRAVEGYRRLLKEWSNSDESFIAKQKLAEIGSAP